MCGRFPGSVMIRITNPFDQVFLAVISLVVVKDFVDFKFYSIVDGDRVRRRRVHRVVWDGVRSLIWAENRYVKDWMYLEGVWEVEFVCDRGDLLNDLVGANEPVL